MTQQRDGAAEIPAGRIGGTSETSGTAGITDTVEATGSFGRMCTERVTTPAELLMAEQQAGRGARFQETDALVGRLLERLLTGDEIVAVAGSERLDRRLTYTGLSTAERTLLDETWAVSRLNRRGTWFLPDRATLHVGLIQLPRLYLHRGSFTGTLIDEQRYRATLSETADAVLLWAVFEPLCQTLYLPFLLRGQQEGTHTREEIQALWAQADRLYGALGLNVAEETAVMRYGGGWSKLHAADQRSAKRHLVQALARQADPGLAARLRALRLQALLKQYYARAKDGYATSKQVLTKAYQPDLVAYFGGDWVAFLAYLGERPHPDEEIVTAVPEPRLYVGGTAKAHAVAAELGLPADEVARIVGSLWQSTSARSPIEDRMAVLDHFWHVFDALHARQAPGMVPLWGLVDDEGAGPVLLRTLARASASPFAFSPTAAYQPRLYQSRFPADLLADIQRLWGTTLLPSYPERMVSEPYPHALLAETIGPALRFWNGCALTAWFLCEGPYSRTDMAGLASYHARQLAALTELGAPVHPSLFDELIQEQARLGPPQPIRASRDTWPVGGGAHAPSLSLTVTISAGERRAGFEGLRNIITRHRQGWTAAYWLPYLRARWERELRDASRWFSEAVARGGRPPTPRQVAKAAVAPIRHWFGGDISRLYAAIGEKSPIQPVVDAQLPPDPLVVATAVRRALHDAFPRVAAAAQHRQHQQYQQYTQHADQERLVVMIDLLAEQSLWYAQLRGAVGRPPDLKEFGTARLREAAESLAMGPEALWEQFASCVERSLAAAQPGPPL